MATPSGEGLFIVSSVGQITGPINGLTWAFVAGNPSLLFAYYNNTWNQIASTGAGTITGVIAGTGLNGGGLSGTVTLNLNTQPYYMAFGFSGNPTSGQYALQTPGQTVTLPANLSTSSANIGTNPTATAVFSLTQNGTQIATVSISTGGAVTFATSGGAAQTIHANDQIKLIGPNPADSTLADVAITIAGTR